MEPRPPQYRLLPRGDTDVFATFLLPVLVLLWLVPRFVGTATPASPAAMRAISAVRAGASPETGRLEVWGLPHPDADPADLLSQPAIVAARTRLREQISAENDALALRAVDAARKLESAEGDVVGLRLSGWLIPFYDRNAAELRRLQEQGRQRPWDTLRGLASVLEGRLEEPPDGIDVEISGQRRDLTRLFRATGDALREADANAEAAVVAFQRDAIDASADAAGPFRRRGRGRILEIVLAALLGAGVREAVQRRRSGPGSVLALSVAPVLGVGVVLPLEGSSLLPVSPLEGTSLAFLPVSFMLGFATDGILRIASRLDRLFEADDGSPDPDRASTALPAPSAALPKSIPPIHSPATPAHAEWPRAQNLAEEVPQADPPRVTAPRVEAEVPLAHKPDRDMVRNLAQQVMTSADAANRGTTPGGMAAEGAVTGDAVTGKAAAGDTTSPRFEREVEEDPAIQRRSPRSPEKLPFFPRR